jgi:excisionase family DNA binding protein
VSGPLVTLRQAAEEVGLSSEALRRYVHQGRLNAIRVGPSSKAKFMVDPDEVARLVIREPK